MTAQRPAEVILSLEGPRPQRRASVAFRVILAIPHLLWAFVLMVVVMLASVAAWFAALVLGRLPDGLATFLGGTLQYLVRLYAYAAYLLTDRYPPFALDAAEYPISVVLPPPGRLNRAAVLFRLVLAIPVYIVATVVGSGLAVAGVVIWLIVLIAGRMPTSLFEAIAAVLRYQARYFAYLLLLTSDYPRSLFGEKDQTVVTTPAPPDVALAGIDHEPQDVPEPPFGPPRITRLVLSRAARRIVVLFIVLGAVMTIGGWGVSINAALQSSEAAKELDASYERLGAASLDFGAAVSSCGLAGGPECVRAAVEDFHAAATDFREDLRAIRFPGAAVTDAQQLEDDTSELINLLEQMAATSDPNAFQALARQFQEVGFRVDRGYVDLRRQLDFGS